MHVCLPVFSCVCVHVWDDSNVYVFPLNTKAQRFSWQCSAAKLAWEAWEHFPLTNRGQSITSRLRKPLSIWRWADTAVPAAGGGKERGKVGMEMIALQAVKCAGNPLWTQRYTPAQSSGGGVKGSGERMHTRLVGNTKDCSLFSCECNLALLVYLFLTHICSTSIYPNAAA